MGILTRSQEGHCSRVDSLRGGVGVGKRPRFTYTFLRFSRLGTRKRYISVGNGGRRWTGSSSALHMKRERGNKAKD